MEQKFRKIVNDEFVVNTLSGNLNSGEEIMIVTG